MLPAARLSLETLAEFDQQESLGRESHTFSCLWMSLALGDTGPPKIFGEGREGMTGCETVFILLHTQSQFNPDSP